MTTNARERLMEEFLASNQLHIIKEEIPRTKFHSSRGQSNIDITITDSKMLAAIENWGIADEECASDHNIQGGSNITGTDCVYVCTNQSRSYLNHLVITFHITIEKDEGKITNPPGFRFVIKEKQRPVFYEKFYSTISKKFHIERKREGQEGMDNELSRG